MAAVEPRARPVPPVSADDIRAARELLAGVVTTTPVARSRALAERCGGPVHVHQPLRMALLVECEALERGPQLRRRQSLQHQSLQ